MKEMPRVEQFINDALANSSGGKKLEGYIAPYKPALLLAIIEKHGVDMFNRELEVKEFTNKWYDLITLTPVMEEKINSMSWINKPNKEKAIATQISSMPAFFLQREDNEFYVYDKKRRVMKFNSYDYNKQDTLTLLRDAAIASMGKCYRDFTIYGNLNSESIDRLEKIFMKRKNSRPTNEQRKFREKIMKKYNECVCCPHTTHLEAAHIKPYVLSFVEEEFSIDNGVAMCRNCHKSYDDGLISFDSSRVARCETYIKAVKYMEEHFKYNVNLSPLAATLADYHFNNIYKCKKDTIQ